MGSGIADPDLQLEWFARIAAGAGKAARSHIGAQGWLKFQQSIAVAQSEFKDFHRQARVGPELSFQLCPNGREGFECEDVVRG